MKFRVLARVLAMAAPLAAAQIKHVVRVSGTIEPVHSVVVQVPRVQGQGGNLTLTRLVDSGSACIRVKSLRSSIIRMN